MWIQTRAFDPDKGGEESLMCLRNVRLGYGIPALHINASDAWKATQQHKDRNIPKGVAVPIFFSWKVDGHIGVQLPDGRFWTDGKIYKDLASYEATSSPKYLGWGESVNSVMVIERKDMLTKEEVIELHIAYFGGKPGKDYDFRHAGGTLEQLIKDWKPGSLKGTIDTLNKTIGIKDKEIERLKAQVGESNKWEVFKSLIKELFS